MIEAQPVLEEPSLAELPPTREEVKEVWDRSTGLPLDPEMVAKHDGKRGNSCHSLVSPSRRRLKSVMNSPVTTPFRLSSLTSTKVNWLLWKHHIALALTPTTGTRDLLRLHHLKRLSSATYGPKPERECDELVCEFLDISRAHFHAPIVRLIFVSIDGMVHKLWRTMYGLQDAGAAFGRIKEAGRQASHLHALRVASWKPRGATEMTTQDLSKHFLLKSRGVLDRGDIGEISCLGRIVRWMDERLFPNDDGAERIEIEVDPRHSQILVSAVNLSDQSKPVGTPGARVP